MIKKIRGILRERPNSERKQVKHHLYMERFQEGNRVVYRYLVMSDDDVRINQRYIQRETCKLTARGRGKVPDDVLEVTRWCRVGTIEGGDVVVYGARYPLSSYPLSN